MQFDLNQLRELLAIVNQTDIAELSLKSSDFELTIRKCEQARTSTSGVTASAALDSSTAANFASATESPQPALNKRWVEIISPMVGTFYRSPGPDESAFVEEGDVIRKGQTVCIIEAMKLMNELEAEVNGEVKEILVQNGEPIEYGQPLMRVDPRQD